MFTAPHQDSSEGTPYLVNMISALTCVCVAFGSLGFLCSYMWEEEGETRYCTVSVYSDRGVHITGTVVTNLVLVPESFSFSYFRRPLFNTTYGIMLIVSEKLA